MTALNWRTVPAALGFFITMIAHADSSGRRVLSLHLPGKVEQSFELQVQHKDGVEFLYEEPELLDGLVGAEWMSRLARLIGRAHDAYAVAKSAGLLSYCDADAQEGKYPLILLKPGKTRRVDSADELFGYYRIDNPGPLIEADIYQEPTAERIIVHEMVHAWCGSAKTRAKLTVHDRWLEEGVADWVAYRVLGKLPQLSVTRYFKKSCAPTRYGSSFLWVFANLDEATQDASKFQATLAELHIGLKAETGLFGSLPLDPAAQACEESESATPFGQILTECPKKLGQGSFCLALWRTPWGEVGLEPSRRGSSTQAGQFVWTARGVVQSQKSRSE